MFCENCGNEIKEKSKFCQECGTPLINYNSEVLYEKTNTADNSDKIKVLCKNCRAEIKTDSEFCQECGFSVKFSLMSLLADTLTKVIEKSDKESNKVSVAESKTETSHDNCVNYSTSSEPKTVNEIIKDCLESLILIPISWLTSELINAIVIPCFSDGLIFIKFLPYCLLCLLLAVSVFGIPLSFINIIYYAIKSDNKNIILHTKSLLVSIAILIVSYTLLASVKIFFIVMVIFAIVAYVLDKRGLLDDDKKEKV